MGFSIGSTVRFGWETFKKRPWLFVGATLLLFIASIMIKVLGRVIDGLSADLALGPLIAVALVNMAIYFALSTLYGMGTTAFGLAAHDNPDAVKLSALWHPNPFWKFSRPDDSLLAPYLGNRLTHRPSR